MNFISALLAFVIFGGICLVSGMPIWLGVGASLLVGFTVGN